MDKKIALKRLAFIKYLVTHGNEETNLPEPMAASAILTFHDAIELFLQLSSEEYNIDSSNVSFMNYWNKLNPILIKNGKKELSQKESIRRLNKARVSLKHHGMLPSKSEISDFRATVSIFFEDNCINIFKVAFENISLIELISNNNTKKYLLEAKNDYNKSNINGCVSNLALAFAYMIRDYEISKIGRYGQSPFFFGKDLTFLTSFSMGLNSNDKIAKFIDEVQESIESIQKAIKILSFGIDYRKYVKFSMLTPGIDWNISGNPLISTQKKAKMSKDEYDFCLNFIIEAALMLQDFDFIVSD